MISITVEALSQITRPFVGLTGIWISFVSVVQLFNTLFSLNTSFKSGQNLNGIGPNVHVCGGDSNVH